MRGGPTGLEGAENPLFEPILRAARGGSWPHAAVVQAPQPLWERLELEIALALLCPEGGCRSCPDCSSIKAGSHPDLISLRPQRRGLGIEETRALKADLFSRPLRGPRRVAFVHGADLMSAPAAISLLKVLEEPPEHAHLFLFAERAELLPPTVRSRCWTWVLSEEREGGAEIQRGKSLELSPSEIASLSRASREELLEWLKGLSGLEGIPLRARLELEKLRAISERANLSSPMVVDLAVMIASEEVGELDLYSPMGQGQKLRQGGTGPEEGPGEGGSLRREVREGGRARRGGGDLQG